METDMETRLMNRMREIWMEQSRSFYRGCDCYSASFLDENQAAQIEAGDKIIMPPSALRDLSALQIDYPMLFEVENPNAPRASRSTQRVSHCGVWEFTAKEGVVYLPYWMMENLHLKDGDVVRIKNVTLPKGKFVKLQPHTSDFLHISNPRAVLEKTLRSFTCLTTGDTIKIPYNSKEYYVDIMETKPLNAISIVDTDCEVDFAPPLDYKEPEMPVAAESGPLTNKVALASPDQVEEPKFSVLTGAGRRLDGKPLKNHGPTEAVSSISSFSAPAIDGKGTGHPSSAGSIPKGSSSRAQGKLVFGSKAANHTPTSKGTNKQAPNEQATLEKKEEQKFQPFTGKKYSLI